MFQEKIAPTLEVENANPPVRLLSLFNQLYPQMSPERIIKTPARDMWVAATAVKGSYDFMLCVPDIRGRTRFSLRSARQKRTVFSRPLPYWARYPAGVAMALYDSGMEVPGMNIAIAGDEPLGPRYAHALGMAFGALCHHLNQKLYTEDILFEVVERVRREFIE